MDLPDDTESELDPVFVSSLRESKWILLAWLVNFLWVVGFGVARGYEVEDVENLATILGMPAWVFWGIFLPWIVTTLFTTWFALAQMADHPLEDDAVAASEESSDG